MSILGILSATLTRNDLKRSIVDKGLSKKLIDENEPETLTMSKSKSKF